MTRVLGSADDPVVRHGQRRGAGLREDAGDAHHSLVGRVEGEIEGLARRAGEDDGDAGVVEGDGRRPRGRDGDPFAAVRPFVL